MLFFVFVEQGFSRYSGIVFEGSDVSQDMWLNDVACSNLQVENNIQAESHDTLVM